MTMGPEEEEEEGEEEEERRRRRGLPEGLSLVCDKLYTEAQHCRPRAGSSVELRSATGREERAEETQRDQALRPKLTRGWGCPAWRPA